jgi:hypothetical protein
LVRGPDENLVHSDASWTGNDEGHQAGDVLWKHALDALHLRLDSIPQLSIADLAST